MSLSIETLVNLSKQVGLKVDLATLAPEHSLQDIGLDSLALVKLLYAVEDEFDVTLSTEEMLELKTVGDLRKMLEAKLAGA